MSQDQLKPLSTESIKSGKVKPKQPVTIYGTGANKNMPAGKSYVVHEALAEKLTASGAATKDKPSTKEKKEVTK